MRQLIKTCDEALAVLTKLENDLSKFPTLVEDVENKKSLSEEESAIIVETITVALAISAFLRENPNAKKADWLSSKVSILSLVFQIVRFLGIKPPEDFWERVNELFNN